MICETLRLRGTLFEKHCPTQFRGNLVHFTLPISISLRPLYDKYPVTVTVFFLHSSLLKITDVTELFPYSLLVLSSSPLKTGPRFSRYHKPRKGKWKNNIDKLFCLTTRMNSSLSPRHVTTESAELAATPVCR